MKLSIITINRNNLEGLKKTLASVQAQQTDIDWEWIIVDGASTDGSSELVRSLDLSNLTAIIEPDSGIYNAMNKGILASKGEYLLFLNSGDALASPDVIETVAEYLIGDTDLVIGSVRIDETVHSVDLGTVEKVVHRMNYFSIFHQATFMHRSLFERYGFYREDHRISSDWWFFYKCLIAGDATFEVISFVVTDYDSTGISSANNALSYSERETLSDELPRLKYLAQFYRDNQAYINIMRANSMTWRISKAVLYLLRCLAR